MDRRNILGTVSCALAGLASGVAKPVSQKKGFGLLPESDPLWRQKLQALNTKWFYTWGHVAPQGIPAGIGFIPMQWGKWKCTAENVAAIKAAGHQTLLGFNEPDQKNQAKLSVEQALELWPTLMDAGMRLGSPACVNPDGDWMTAFMTEAQKRGYRIDFIAVHSYYGKYPNHFLTRLEKIYKLYKKPIWITEFAVADWSTSKGKPNRYSPDDVLKFMESALPALEKIDYVERYAWFSGNRPPLKPSRLFDDEGCLTRLGEFYASI